MDSPPIRLEEPVEHSVRERLAYADGHVLARGRYGRIPAGDVTAFLVVGPFGSRIECCRGYVAKNYEAIGMGTTLTAVRLAGERLGLLHVGDSRAYLLRRLAAEGSPGPS